VLSALVEHANQYVPKASIMDAAWPGVVVEESNLAVQISAIRHAFAQVPGGEHWVETLARRGYRFVGPLTELRELRELRERRPSDDRAGDKRTNLPEPLTSFIGRERELVEIKRLLPGKRLLTLVGVGGIGKTRLALQAAAEVMDAYRDGVWLVELASVTDASVVPTSVAHVLGVQEKAATPLTQTLCKHLESRQLLLLLDNCEHLLDACAGLTEAILRGAGEATILATSREPLHVAGEQTYALPVLSLPDSEANAQTVARSEAVQLFVERAQRQQPDFELTPERAPAIARLCIHLDGIPLALELAAARIRSLSIEQINARLGDRFRLLTEGTHTALPRQQTLRATFDWSFDLLTEQERVILRRLAVFAGGFILEAASAVASDDTIDEYAVIDLLSQLVSRSLVIADTNDAGARYRLLETTRAYALEKLSEAGEISVIKRRHARYFRDRFEPAPGREHMSDRQWRAVYVPECDNVRAALDWALGPGGDPAIGIALAASSRALWSELSVLSEGRRRLDVAVGRIDDQTPVREQARAWVALGILLGTAAPARAADALARGIELYRRLGEISRLGPSLVELGRIWMYMGRFDQAAAVLAEAYPLLERANLPRQLAHYFESLGFLRMLTGDVPGARALLEKALPLSRSAEAESTTLSLVLNLAEMTWALGDLDAALAGFQEAISLMRKSPYATRKSMIGTCLSGLAGVHTERGELPEALAAATEGLPMRRESDFWGALDHLGLRAALAGKVSNAARLAGYTDAIYAAKESTRHPNETRARERLQRLLSEKLSRTELERLLDEGAKLSEDEACRLALEK
jgi:predicted ATPase